MPVAIISHESCQGKTVGPFDFRSRLQALGQVTHKNLLDNGIIQAQLRLIYPDYI